MKLPGMELSGLDSPAFESLDLPAAGCLAFAGSVTGEGLVSRTGDCRVGIGAGGGAEDVGEKILKTGLVAATGLKSWAGEDAGWSVGWTAEVLRTDDGAGCVSSSAGLSGAGENGAPGTDGDWRIGDRSREKTVAPVGIWVWNWLSAGGAAVESAVVVTGETVGETGVGEPCASEAGTVGVGKTEATEVEDCACAVDARVGTLGNEYAVSEET